MDGIDYRELKKENAQKNLDETRRGCSELESLPRYVMVELTQGCNLRCPMCRSRPIAYGERVMDRDMLHDIAAVLFPTAEIVDIRGWGESLLAPDIGPIVELVASYQARCRVVTNLSVNRPDILDLLLDREAMIDVSLDVAQQEVLDVVRPGTRLTLVDKNLRRLTRRLRASPHGLDSLRIIATLQRLTLQGLPELVSYAGSVGVRQIVLNEVTLAPGDPNAVVGLEDEVDRAVAAATAVAAQNGVELYAGTALGHCAGVKKDVPFCLHPWAYATVGYDGSIGYCDHLIGPMMPFSHMGDINESDFRTIWNGDAWQALRRWHSSTNRSYDSSYGACFKCYQHRNVDFEDVFEPRLQRYQLPVVTLTADQAPP